MTSRSFRGEFSNEPPGFRTPSPPPYETLDPASPNTAAWSAAWTLPERAQKSFRSNAERAKAVTIGQRKRKSYAKTTQSHTFDHSLPLPVLTVGEHGQSYSSGPVGRESDALQRPSKRAKSEHRGANEEAAASSRPHTSYHARSEVATADAELLLNFSRTASSEVTNATLKRRQLAKNSPLSNHELLQTDRGTVNGDQQLPVKTVVSTAVIPSLNLTQPHNGSNQLKALGLGTNGFEAGVQNQTASDGPEKPAPTAESETIPSQAPEIKPNSENDSTVYDVEKTAQLKTATKQDEISTNKQSSAGQSVERAEKAVDPNTTADNSSSRFPAGHSTETAPSSSKHSQKSPSVCAGCGFHRNSLAIEGEHENDSWISCDGCKSWFHFACAGFKNEREVRSVDKYRCRQCKGTHGPTTYVRKSGRAHSAIDYAGLNEGIVKTSDENPLHHYIKPIKDGTIRFDPENFARMRPELVTRDFFEKGDGMREPVLIPAALNPRPRIIPDLQDVELWSEEAGSLDATEAVHDLSVLDDWREEDYEFEQVQDNGQDALGMIIPKGLTVRKVSELYGPDEKIDVIDVKSQNGEDKKWTMKRWADYYESKGNKKVRNVISLEVSQSRLGRLIQRPKVVRDLDLQDSVWPAELIAKGDFPKVQFYCLMSVADCYTDFHIDFGGSSVYYHILEGKKTFFFIPPYEKHLKKYEEWCNSPAQNWTFLGDQTKECYRVDLSAGDTMLIPAGWIHAVWTPEDSLVIGGNFLTCLNLPMQIRVTQIEKATGVDRKFRYPAFQKVMWYTALRYLEDDPIPDSVIELLASGQAFTRKVPTHLDFERWGENSAEGPENYQYRYYSKAELDGLPELARYLYRTALIAMGIMTEGITTRVQDAVKRSIPKGSGDPLQTVKKFAMWCTWKCGDETLPHWAYPDYVHEGGGSDLTEKKLSAKAMKRLDREAAMQAWKIAPDRQSTRVRNQQSMLAETASGRASPSTPKQEPVDPEPRPPSEFAQEVEGTPAPVANEDSTTPSKTSRSDSSSKTWGGRRPACEACRKGRRACKHRDDPFVSSMAASSLDGAVDLPVILNLTALGDETLQSPMPTNHQLSPVQGNLLQMEQLEIVQQNGNIGGYISRLSGPNDSSGATQSKSSGRSKACKDCRKSKRRCIHDEFGNQDPVKLAEAAIPRPAAKKRKPNGESADSTSPKRSKMLQDSASVNDTSLMGKEQESRIPAATVASVGVTEALQTVNDTSHNSLDDSITESADGSAAMQTTGDGLLEPTAKSATSSPISESKHEGPRASEYPADASTSNGVAASSLVSPPDSTHVDAEQTPPVQDAGEVETSPATSMATAMPAPLQKVTPRYTPDSNTQRRPSMDGDAASPTVSVDTAGSAKRHGGRLGSDHEADEESLKLIRQLAAQDMGLRRRAKVG